MKPPRYQEHCPQRDNLLSRSFCVTLGSSTKPNLQGNHFPIHLAITNWDGCWRLVRSCRNGVTGVAVPSTPPLVSWYPPWCDSTPLPQPCNSWCLGLLPSLSLRYQVFSEFLNDALFPLQIQGAPESQYPPFTLQFSQNLPCP